MEVERQLGFEPTDREYEKLGYDIESREPRTGRLRFLEVKGRVSGAATITVTKNEILYSLNKPEDFILAIVEFLEGDAHRVHYVRRPFQREPDFGVTSVNYDFAELLARAESSGMNERTAHDHKKKLIEVALPLEAINKASAGRKSSGTGTRARCTCGGRGGRWLRLAPSSLRRWWMTRRATLSFSRRKKLRRRNASASSDSFENWCFGKTPANEAVLAQAREEIWKSWRATCAENQNHPRAKELFDPEKLPAFHDPFAGGGSLPLEAQRLGLEELCQRPESGRGAHQ